MAKDIEALKKKILEGVKAFIELFDLEPDIVPKPVKKKVVKAEVPDALKGLERFESDKYFCSKWHDVYKAWLEAYPGLDILKEVKKAHAWEIASKAHYKRDHGKFLNNWLARAFESLHADRRKLRKPNFDLKTKEVLKNHYGRS